MRVLILHNAYAQRGGEDSVVETEVAGLRSRGHAVDLLIRDSAELHKLPLLGAAETLATVANPDAARALERALDRFRPDVVHVHNLFPRWGLSVLRVLARRRVPAVQTLHNFRWLCAPATRLRNGEDCTLCAGGNFTHAVRFACVRSNRVVSAAYALALSTNRVTGLAESAVRKFICVSEFVRQVHREAGFPDDKLVVKGHFVAHAPGALDMANGSILYAGRFSAEKGLPWLLSALRRLPGRTLRIAGDGAERTQLEASLGELRTRVTFLGRLSREELWRELRTASVCVVPSIGSETFGLAVIEAFACGCPVVASDAGGLPELVKSGENGWVVPRGDADALAARVEWLLARPETARAFGEAGRELVRTSYLPESNIRQLEHIYQEAIASR